MAEYKESSGYCPHCRRQVVGRREEASHTFWLIATLFSCGLFAIVWLISSLSKASKPFHCSVCGTAIQAFPATTPSHLLPKTAAGTLTGTAQTAASSKSDTLVPVCSLGLRQSADNLTSSFVNLADSATRRAGRPRSRVVQRRCVRRRLVFGRWSRLRS